MASGHHPLEHAMDQPTLEVPGYGFVHLPVINLGLFKIQITRFMVLELIAALLIILIFVPLARHVAKQRVTRGRFMNAFEMLVLAIRDKVARASIGGHGADVFVPYLLTVFFFILFNNLFGLLPGGGSATGNVNVTGVLALSTFVAVMYAGVKASGWKGFFVNLVPKMELPIWLKGFLWPLMFVIEVAGLLIRHFVLALRLFANMMAGHVVIGVILGFILAAQGALYYFVMPASIVGAVAITMLELLVACLQAYIFTLLSSLFIGSAAHPH
jgi:F-type H+-transporting ATPase subunit a